MRTLKIDADTGDLVFENGAVEVIDADEALAQSIRSRVRMIRGEWYADESIGLPLPNDGQTEADVRREVEAVEGIASMSSYSREVDRTTREATITVTVIKATGGELTVEDI
jgi:hypothetical protein